MERSKVNDVRRLVSNKEPLARYIVWLIAAAWVYTLTFVFNNYWSKYASYAAVTASYQHSLQKKEAAFDEFVKDTFFNRKLLNGLASVNEVEKMANLPFEVFLYQKEPKETRLLFWSTNDVVPDSIDVLLLPGGNFVAYGSGKYEFLKQTIQLGNKKYEVIGLVLLQRAYFIENARLQSSFPEFDGLQEKLRIVETPTPYLVKGATDEPLFYFSPLVPEPIYVFNILSFATGILSLLLIFIYVYRVASYQLLHNRIMHCFITMIIAIISVFGLLRWGFPFDIYQLPPPILVNTEALKRNWYQLLEMIVFTVTGLLIALFFNVFFPVLMRKWLKTTNKIKWILLSIACLLFVLFNFLLVQWVEFLYLSPLVSTHLINFQSLNQSTLFVLLLLFLWVLLQFLLLRLLVLLAIAMPKRDYWWIVLLLIVAGLIVLTIDFNKLMRPALLVVLFWLVAVFLVYFKQQQSTLNYSLKVNVVWLFVYALSMAALLSFFSGNRVRKEAGEFADGLIMQNDKTISGLIKVATNEISRLNWPVLLSNATNPAAAAKIKSDLLQKYFGGYLDRFSTDIYFFNGVNQPIDTSQQVSFDQLNTLFNQVAIPTIYNGLASFEVAFDKFGFIYQLPVFNENGGQKIGVVFVVARPTLLKNQAVAPELFRQMKDFDNDLPRGVSYAWYLNGLLHHQYRNYSFPAFITTKKGINQSKWNVDGKDAFELWTKVDGDYVLAVAHEYRWGIRYITIVAYLFCAFVVFNGIFQIIRLIWVGRFFKRSSLKLSGLTLQTQIRLIIIGILIIVFFVIAIITISFFTSQFTSDNEERLAKASQLISNQITRNADLVANGNDYSLVSNNLQEVMNKASTEVNADANLYDNKGRLIATTQRILYDNNVLSRLMEPVAWWKLSRTKVNRIIVNEKVGLLTYTSIYQQITNRQQKVIGYLQIPWFASENELNQEISNFVVILINLIAFVFLISGVLALWMSSSITNSFSLIREKMNRVRLSEKNERIEWSRKDEIGQLVHQYNRMIDQLEDSASKLAKNEREMAWREMARQVAHEIKNPLTPMKLSLQFLQKAIAEHRPNMELLAIKVAGNLVDQIDHLNRIAGEFSQFANLNQVNLQPIDFCEEIKQVVQLYGMQDEVQILWQPPTYSFTIIADKTQINRLLTNLFQNAFESQHIGRKLVITLKIIRDNQKVVFSIADNGKGISVETQKSIFIPNFTTKNSGTGLGLAMSKAIVEKIGGQIWFTTKWGEGTTFFVSFLTVNGV